MEILKNKNHAIDFNSINNSEFFNELQKAIKIARQNISKIKESPASFENTIEGLELASDDVSIVSDLFFNLHSAEAQEEIQELAPKMSETLSSFTSDITLDNPLFLKIKDVYDSKSSLDLNNEQLRLLNHTYESFTRNGALLNPEQKEQLRKIDQELSVISPNFAKNVLDATNEFKLVVTNKEDLVGLPASSIDAAKEEAEGQDLKDSWVFTLQFPSLYPFLKYTQNRELRYKMWKASSTRAFKDNFDNQDNVLKTAQLRYRRAQLLGYSTHAEFVLSKRMAETPEKVTQFLDELYTIAKPSALKELEEIRSLAKEDGIDELQSWDTSYYSEKLKQKKFNFDEEKLRPYFPLEKVIDGAFEHAKKLYNLEFKKTEDYPIYHKDVQVFEVYDSDNKNFVGLLYADFFPRPTKRPGAWMTNYRSQGLFKGEVLRPHVGIVCNFTKPTVDKPSLLTFMEVRTLFHEFGHALHGLVSDCTYASLSGTNVYWDFVELPSQLLENWVLEEEGLNLFASHYETREPIPKEYVDKIKESSQFLAGLGNIRQLSLGHLDMSWHNCDPSSITDVESFEEKTNKKFQLLPKTEPTSISCSFGHIFSGGYSAGYYSYKWAEVLDADAFEFFKEEGVFNSKVAQLFKDNILKKGNTEHPMELYKKFRGREPDTKALLRRDGLI